MIEKPWFRALLLGLGVAALGGMLKASGWALPVALGAAAVGLVVTGLLPVLGVRWLDAAIGTLRRISWRREEGRHHAFNGVLLDVQDDGRHVWIAAAGVHQLLGTTTETQLAARLPGRTRRDEAERLQLRVDALAEYLRSGTTSRDPARLRFLHYLERDLLFPAAERRRRSERID